MYPLRTKLIAGQSFTLYCVSYSEITWTFEGGPLPGDAIENFDSFGSTYVLKIQNVSKDHHGIYECHNRKNEQISSSTLEVFGKCACIKPVVD